MKRWRLVSIAVCLAALTFGLIHTPPLRRAVLSRVAAYLYKSQRIVLHAQSFDYNLLTLRFSLDQVSLRHSTQDSLPPFLTASRLRFRLKFSDLVRGALRAQSVEGEGLRLEAVVRRDGNTNIGLNAPKPRASGRVRLPFDTLKISNLALSFHDEQTGLSVQLPDGAVTSSSIQETGDQEIGYALLKPGKVGWGSGEIPIENLAILILIRDDAILLKSLRVIGEGIKVQVDGGLQEPGLPNLNLLARADVQGLVLSSWLGLKKSLAGPIQAKVKISGTLQRPVAEAEILSSELRIGGLRSNSFAAKGRFDSSTGILEIRELATNINGGLVRANGQLSLSGQGRSEVQIEAREVDLFAIGTALGWRAPPRGKASAELAVSYPGSRWRDARMSAGLVVALRPGAGCPNRTKNRSPIDRPTRQKPDSRRN